ncbi:MAG: thiolase family protein [Thermaerobacter sp.]|nr:thiolase family protein [Thermaerobacter sp.]
MGVVILSAKRTPVGSFGGGLRDVKATELGRTAGAAALETAGIEKDQVDHVVFGSGGMPIAEANLARQVGLHMGLPYEVPAYTVQRNCASGIQAIVSGAQEIMLGQAQVVLAGGAESMSGAPYLTYGARFGIRLRHAELRDSIWEGLTDLYSGTVMGETAEILADDYDISRREMDELAVESHQKAFKASRSGRFKDEIAPVEIPSRRGEPEVIRQDEGILAGLSPERLATAPATFRKGGRVTPGNSSPLNDAGAAVVLADEEWARAHGKKPIARIVSYAFSGCDPKRMGLGPVRATDMALTRAGLSLSDIGLIEINEAFAAQYLAVEREMKWNREIVNVNGGALALGHPIGATGARLVTTLVHEMPRRDVRYGLATLCVGGGQGASIIVEVQG